jgi:hypothetical protein
MDAFFFVELKTEEADPIEETVKGPQGTQYAAEKPADQNRADDYKHQHGYLVPEKKSDVLP